MEKIKYYPIRAAAQLTGLNHHIIRKWEQRYGAVTPQRTETNRRLYSESDVERLSLLKAATERGHNIGYAVNMNNDELRTLLRPDTENEVSGIEKKNGKDFLCDPRYHYNKCLYAVKEINQQDLRSSLYAAEHQLSKRTLLEQVVIPLLHAIGTLWETGSINVAHEHTASAVIRTYIGNLITSLSIPDNAPVMIVAAPADQRHEIGALIAAIIAITEGWNAVYLGADLPAQDILAVAQSQKAKIIAVSIIYPEDNSETRKELTILKEGIDDTVYLIAGGGAAHSYGDLFTDANIKIFNDFNQFRVFLHKIKQ